MAEQPESQDQPDDAASPVPNRRERRGKKSGAPAPHGGRSTVPHRSGPAALPRQYSTRRRSG
jgi:hypothetical protein